MLMGTRSNSVMADCQLLCQLSASVIPCRRKLKVAPTAHYGPRSYTVSCVHVYAVLRTHAAGPLKENIMPKLTEAEITAALHALQDWGVRQDALHKQFEFADFAAAMWFVNRVAALAEAADHHPDIDIRYNKVTIALSTHSEGGITEKDVALAREIEGAKGSAFSRG